MIEGFYSPDLVLPPEVVSQKCVALKSLPASRVTRGDAPYAIGMIKGISNPDLV